MKGTETSHLSVRLEKSGRTQSITKGLHCCEKKIINSPALALYFIINLLFF